MTALRFCGLWLSPVLLLGVAAHLYAGAPLGVLLALLVVLAPCMALLGERGEPAEDTNLFVVVLTVLAVVLLLTANLLLIGDAASTLGAERWHGVVIAAGLAFALTIVPSAERWWPLLVPAALALVWLALAAVAHASGVGPMTAWSEVASGSPFRLAPDSPWVTSGGTFPTAGTLIFTEPYTLRAADHSVFSVIVSDGRTPTVQEWRPEPGATMTLRPGDRLAYRAGARLILESGKRVPGGPLSGATWADPTSRLSPLALAIQLLGLALTFVAGGLPLLRIGAPTTRAEAALGLALLLAGVGWTLGWAIYAARSAPELFLGALRAGSLVQLPALAIGGPSASRLGGVVLAALIGLFAATASGLRERIAALDRSGGELGRDIPLWAGVFGVAVVASLWPRDPWSLLVVALGIVASTLAPLAGAPAGTPPRAQAVAGATGLAVFALVGLGGHEVAGAIAEGLTAHPALLAAPAAWVALRLVRARAA